MTHIHPTYDNDKRVVINGITRDVAISDKNRPVLIQYDNNSEVVTFEVDRYVEGHDLSLSNKAEVHYNNLDIAGRRSSKGLYEATDLQVDPSDKTKVIVSWYISNQATEYEGTLNFVLSFSCLEDDVLNVYRWNSRIGTFHVSAGINNSEYLENTYADVLEMWKQTLFGIGDTEEASMLAVSQRQQDLIEQKAAEVLESMPDEYMEYSEFEQRKANVSDINRLFDSDWIRNTRANYYPHGDASFIYDGVGSYIGRMGNNFYLDEGEYVLIITDTKAYSIVLTAPDTVRLVELKENFVGIHRFKVNSTYANKPLQLSIYASGANPNEAGEYYLKRPYIFKNSDVGVFADDFFVRSSIRLFESDMAKKELGDNLYLLGDIESEYDGIATYTGKTVGDVYLDEGDYALTIMDSNYINFIIHVDDGGTMVRLLSTKEVPMWTRFTVPAKYANKPLKLYFNTALSTPGVAGDYYAKNIYIHKDNGNSFLPKGLTMGFVQNGVKDLISGTAYKAEQGCLSMEAATLSPNSTLSINATCNVKTNKSLSFTATFDSFKGLSLGHGKITYGGSYLDISGEDIKVYQYTSSATLSNTYTHNLTISEFISVIINVGVGFADVTIITSDGSFTAHNVKWAGSNGLIFAESINTEFFNCELRWRPSCISERIWIFGDSYLGLTDNRWAGQMHKLGYKGWLASGYPGGKSTAELASFKTLLKLGTPEMVIWCLGMNDGDEGSINESWMTCVEEVLALCEKSGIIPVLATIPTCPAVDNTYKNSWVVNSGKRYVDFNKAVGVNGTAWYKGTLSSDNVHPTELGAKILAGRVCIDVPEIMHATTSNGREFIDSVTGKMYELNVVNGDLMMSEVK